jgi:hypothetical protein
MQIRLLPAAAGRSKGLTTEVKDVPVQEHWPWIITPQSVAEVLSAPVSTLKNA